MALPNFLFNLGNTGRAISAINRSWRVGGINNIIATNNMLKTFQGLISRSQAGALVSIFRQIVESGLTQSGLTGDDELTIGSIFDSPRFRGEGFGDARFKYLVLIDIDTGGQTPKTSRIVIESDSILSADELEDRIVDLGIEETNRYRLLGEIGPGTEPPVIMFQVLGVVRSF